MANLGCLNAQLGTVSNRYCSRRVVLARLTTNLTAEKGSTITVRGFLSKYLLRASILWADSGSELSKSSVSL